MVVVSRHGGLRVQLGVNDGLDVRFGGVIEWRNTSYAVLWQVFSLKVGIVVAAAATGVPLTCGICLFRTGGFFAIGSKASVVCAGRWVRRRPWSYPWLY